MMTSLSTMTSNRFKAKLAYAIARGACVDDACVSRYEDSVNDVYGKGASRELLSAAAPMGSTKMVWNVVLMLRNSKMGSKITQASIGLVP